MCIVTNQERTQQIAIIGSHCGTHALPAGKLGPPLADLGRLTEDCGVDELVEHIEIAEDGRKNCIDQAESCAGEEWSLSQRRLDTRELRSNRLPLAFENCGVRGRLEAPEVTQDRRAEFHPGAMF